MSPPRFSETPPPNVDRFIATFFDAPTALGTFEPVIADAMPPACQALLAHDDHMTVTHEAFYGVLVNVQVLTEMMEATTYSRQSLLRKSDDGKIVQFGVMRIDLGQVDERIRNEINEKQTPLGRVLIRNNVLRHVELIALYHITPSEYLADALGDPSINSLYGRTARIHVNGRPAVELLEIVRTPNIES